MAKAEAARDDWVLSNPWAWMVGGLTASGGALLWARVFQDGASAVRFLLFGLGLLAAGVALCLRLRPGARPVLPHLPRLLRDGLLFLLAAGATIIALAGGYFLVRELARAV